MAVSVVLPGSLADLVGQPRVLRCEVGPGTLGDLLDAIAREQPALERRLRDERGALRRHVNLYVDGTDVRVTGGLATPVPAAAEVHVLASVAGG